MNLRFPGAGATILVALGIQLAASPALGAAAPLRAADAHVARRLDAVLQPLAGTHIGQSPALSIALAQRGHVVYVRGFGRAGAGTRFRIASITKMFTAVAVMQLVQQHRIDLDARVATYVHDAPYARKITVRELLEHRSGLWNYGDEAFADGSVMKATTPRQILVRAARHSLTATPGTQYAYSNTGYVVLGQIIEHVTGLSLAVYEREHILRIAGMRDTSFGDRHETRVVTGFMRADGPPAGRFDPSWLYADGDIVSTAGDLARFDVALLDGRLVSRRTFALMQADPVATRFLGFKQGLGLMIATSAGLHFVGHHGGLPGFEADNELVPRDGLSLVVLSNAFDFSTARANAAVTAVLYPREGSSRQPPTSPDDVARTARFRATLAGLMNGSIDRSQFTTTASAALTSALLEQSSAALRPLGTIQVVTYKGTQKIDNENVYEYVVTFSSGTSMTWHFVLDADGKIAGINSNG